MTNDRTGKSIGSAGLTYIADKKLERKLGRELNQEKYSRAASWGNGVQHRVLNNLLPPKYEPTTNKHWTHSDGLPWVGSPDAITEDSVVDIKCFEIKNFCITHDAATAGWEMFKDQCEEIAWQLVSNAIICNRPNAELILYVPYQSELDDIREEAELSGLYEYQWIGIAKDEELPYLIEGMHYPNLSFFKFQIPDADRTALTNRVLFASKKLEE